MKYEPPAAKRLRAAFAYAAPGALLVGRIPRARGALCGGCAFGSGALSGQARGGMAAAGRTCTLPHRISA